MEEGRKANIDSLRRGNSGKSVGIKGTPIDYSTPEMQRKIKQEIREKYGYDPDKEDYPVYGSIFGDSKKKK